jgi:hypothetical protein
MIAMTTSSSISVKPRRCRSLMAAPRILETGRDGDTARRSTTM